MSREEQILEAAEELFYERSFDGVGVDEIGKAAGVTGSAIYRHFAGNDEILAVLFDQAVDGLLRLLPLPGGDPKSELADLVRAHAEFASTYHRLAAVWAKEQRALADPYRRSYQRRQHRYVQLWVDCVGRCYSEAATDDVVTAVRGVHCLLMSEVIRPPTWRRSPRAVALLSEIALAGLDVLGRPHLRHRTGPGPADRSRLAFRMGPRREARDHSGAGDGLHPLSIQMREPAGP